jgi:uncharacterized membrane protein SpoIIM required for sporulation
VLCSVVLCCFVFCFVLLCCGFAIGVTIAHSVNSNELKIGALYNN